MGRNWTQIAPILIALFILIACSNQEEPLEDSLNTTPETLLIDNEDHVLNGFVSDIGTGIIAGAELIKSNKTEIDPSIKIGRIFLILNDQVYEESSPTTMGSVESFTLISQAEGLPSWVLNTNTQMVIEVQVKNETHHLRDKAINN